jgi:hypothetical protein
MSNGSTTSLEKPKEKVKGSAHPDIGHDTAASDPIKSAPKRGWRFWAIFPALLVTTMLSAVEVTVTSTALPTIVHELDVGANYV